MTHLFTKIPFRLLWEASIFRYTFIQLFDLEQSGMKKPVQGFKTAAQVSNPGSRSRESEILSKATVEI